MAGSVAASPRAVGSSAAEPFTHPTDGAAVAASVYDAVRYDAALYDDPGHAAGSRYGSLSSTPRSVGVLTGG